MAALIPPPRRLNLVRYHGVLAPNAADRDHIVPRSQPLPQDMPAPNGNRQTPAAPPTYRLTWA